MSDNRRVHRTIRIALKQLFPFEPKGNFARHLNTLAAMVAGIVQGKSSQLPTIARKAPETAKVDSRVKKYSRWLQNERTEYEAYYLPFAQEILAKLAAIRPLVFIIDGSEVGHNCVTLMISLVFQKRTLPIVWLVVEGNKGHPQDYQAIFLGDGEFDGVELQSALQTLGWSYVCRTAKNIVLQEEELTFSFDDLPLRPGDCIGIPNIYFTADVFGPVTAIGWWKKGYKKPISVDHEID
mgnify:CR=1 FL=1